MRTGVENIVFEPVFSTLGPGYHYFNPKIQILRIEVSPQTPSWVWKLEMCVPDDKSNLNKKVPRRNLKDPKKGSEGKSKRSARSF